MRVHWSSAKIEWPTPQDLFDRLNAEFSFTLDVCATSENAKCVRFFTAIADGLAQNWTGVAWMNPPYGRAIGLWMKKASEAARAGATVVCLVPARTDTAWWHDFAVGHEIRFLRDRVKFNGVKDAPFPSAIVVMRAVKVAGLGEGAK